MCRKIRTCLRKCSNGSNRDLSAVMENQVGLHVYTWVWFFRKKFPFSVPPLPLNYVQHLSSCHALSPQWCSSLIWNRHGRPAFFTSENSNLLSFSSNLQKEYLFWRLLQISSCGPFQSPLCPQTLCSQKFSGLFLFSSSFLIFFSPLISPLVSSLSSWLPWSSPSL